MRTILTVSKISLQVPISSGVVLGSHRFEMVTGSCQRSELLMSMERFTSDDGINTLKCLKSKSCAKKTCGAFDADFE